MTEEGFIYAFEELINNLDEDYVRGKLINGDIARIDRLCKKYLDEKAKLYKSMRIENPLNGSD